MAVRLQVLVSPNRTASISSETKSQTRHGSGTLCSGALRPSSVPKYSWGYQAQLRVPSWQNRNKRHVSAQGKGSAAPPEADGQLVSRTSGVHYEQ